MKITVHFDPVTASYWGTVNVYPGCEIATERARNYQTALYLARRLARDFQKAA